MRTIRETVLGRTLHVQTFELLHDAKILYTGVQRDKICLWYEGDTEGPEQRWEFWIRHTGHEVPPRFRHIGSTLLDASMPWHVYARGPFIDSVTDG